jgi:putative endonuclease
MPNNAFWGNFGEDLACEYLKKSKYKIVSRNYRTRLGEIDIVAKKGKQLVFVEVKYGSKDAYLRVNRQKFRRILLASQAFLKEKGNFGTKTYRIDVISISKEREILHFEDVAKDFWG